TFNRASFFFKGDVDKEYNIIIVSKTDIQFNVEISTSKTILICDPVCPCEVIEKNLMENKPLQNQKVNEISYATSLFNEIPKEFLGGEKIYQIKIDNPGIINLTIDSPNEGFAMYLSGSICDQNLYAFTSTGDNGGSASIVKFLEEGVYHVSIDQLKPNLNAVYSLFFSTTQALSALKQEKETCPVLTDQFHMISIRGNPLLLNSDPLTLQDRIYLTNNRNKNTRESNAFNWNGSEVQFKLFADNFGDSKACGYVENEDIQFTIIRGDKVYSATPIYQPEDGTEVNASNKFKRGGRSLIIGFIASLNVKNLGISTFPSISSASKKFIAEVNSNSDWRIERANTKSNPWINYSPTSGTGIADISFIIDANNLTDTRTDTLFLVNADGFYKSIIISQPGCVGPTVNAGVDLNICSGQTVKLNATGIGTINWQNPSTTASVQTYQFEAKQTQVFTAYATLNGCTAVDQINVVVRPKPNVNAGPDRVICFGTPVSLSATGGGTYRWNNNSTTAQLAFIPSQSATYTVTVTKDGCESVDEVSITVIPKPRIELESIRTMSGSFGIIQVKVSGGTPDYKFQWFRNDTLISTQEDLFGLRSGIHKLIVTDANGCTAIFGPQAVIVTNAIDITLEKNIRISPNPTDGLLNLQFQLEQNTPLEINVLDALGRRTWYQ
ncbi:MAG TPA: hypothetical protein PLC89_23575, partial [Haliscomenobacter sp.]|uniref:BACON domain-containing protein n=1 Tax=Haliscomenobacter sp. TaxID=2717303 RepID=UPI002B6FA61E